MIRRLIIEGSVRFTAPFAIGSGQISLASDRPVCTDSRGRPELTATAVAGVLRSTAERLAPWVEIGGRPGEEVVAELFGEALEHTDDGEGTPLGRASRLRVGEPAPLVSSPIAVRDGVGIDRATGAAREAIKYDFEVAELGAAYGLRMELDLDGNAAAAVALLDALVAEWAAGRLAFGGRVATGLGASILEVRRIAKVDLADPDRSDLRGWLRARPAPGPRGGPTIGKAVSLAEVSAGCQIKARQGHVGWFSAEARLHSDGPILFGGPAPIPAVVDHSAVGTARHEDSDAQAMTRGTADGDKAHIGPGSSLRGALRTRAERLVRALASDQTAACDPHSPDACGRRILPESVARDFPMGNARPSVRRELERKRAEALRVQCCPVCRIWGNTLLGGRLRVQEALIEPIRPELIDHVAIDRFTGGAADARKFDAAPLVDASFEVLVSIEAPEPWEIALVLAVVRDLVEGWVPLGSRTARGYGAVRGTVTGLHWGGLAGSGVDSYGGVHHRSGMWTVVDLVPDQGAFLGRSRPWDWVAQVPALRDVIATGMEELGRTARAWRPASA